ncbi:helix-turn-helix transcriptional regulator [Nocardia salmonicida]|uniref:helix-turn-helix transcriptional regulator n=1 Tax=Nocardia salmonicida TaxID=53431 RepID=UPI0036318FF9
MTAGRDKVTMRKLADALADQEFQLKEKLVAARKAAELEQVDIAEALGVDKSTVSRFERLDSNPTLAMIRNYAYAVGCLVKHDVVAFPEEPPYARTDHLLRILQAALVSHNIEAALGRPRVFADVDISWFGKDFDLRLLHTGIPHYQFEPSRHSSFGASGSLKMDLEVGAGS